VTSTPQAGSTGLPALSVRPLADVVKRGVIVRITTPPAAPLLAGLFGAQALLAAQLLTELEPALQSAMGGIGMLSAADLPRGEDTGWILAPFVRAPGPGNASRFSDGRYGVWYGADSQATAQAEVGYHLIRWLAQTKAAPDRLERSVVLALADRQCPLVDLRPPHAADPRVLDPMDYRVAQAFGAQCRHADFWGILWPSVRAPGISVGLLRPRALAQAGPYGTCHALWDGQQVTWQDAPGGNDVRPAQDEPAHER
jgi:hypothetical protein